MEGDDWPAGGGRHRSSRGVDWTVSMPTTSVRSRQALEAHLSGKTDHFQHEHRIRHEDGTYRRFLCRGVAVRGARPAPGPHRRIADRHDASEAIAQEPAPQRRIPRSADRALQPRGLRGGARAPARASSKHGRPAADSRCSISTSTASRSSTTVSATWWATSCSSRCRVASSRACGQGDALARLGGDEFAILLNELGDEEQANAIAFRIQDALSAPFSIGGREVFTSASIGIAFGRAQYNNPDEIMRDADTAMYHAKSRGKARHELFDADMHARELDRLGLENDLRHAVSHNDFEVHYQPIVLLASGMCVGFESLIRWTRNGKPVSPVTFIPIAEELGLIEPLGTWVLQQACTTFADWQRRFPAGGLDYITVNVSSRQLMQQNFLRIVEQAVQDAGLKPCDLRLEITETALMDSPTRPRSCSASCASSA